MTSHPLSTPLQGKVALISGGGTGIGRGIAEAFIAAGAQVMVAGRRLEPLQALADAFPGQAHFVQADIGNDEMRQTLVNETVARLGQLDILVNNALAVYDRPFSEMTAKQMEITYRILLLAPTRMSQLALPHLIKTGGNIINISSVAARYISYPSGGLAVYGAAKAGVEHLTRTLAAELGKEGVRVNAIAPGATLVDSSPEDAAAVARTVAETPLGRMGLPKDIAPVAVFLASEAAHWVTGQVIDASGGWGITP